MGKLLNGNFTEACSKTFEGLECVCEGEHFTHRTLSKEFHDNVLYDVRKEYAETSEAVMDKVMEVRQVGARM